MRRSRVSGCRRVGWCSPGGPGWVSSVPDRLALFTGGIFAASHAKTAHGILRYGTREVVCVVDEASAGAVASEVVPYARHATPIVPTVEEAAKLGSTVLVVAVAPFGGALTVEWRAA